MIDSECVEQVARLLRPPVADEVKSEACWVYLNGVTCGNEEQVDYFVRMGVVEVLQEMIHNNLHNGDVFDALEAVIVGVDAQTHAEGRRQQAGDRRTQPLRGPHEHLAAPRGQRHSVVLPETGSQLLHHLLRRLRYLSSLLPVGTRRESHR